MRLQKPITKTQSGMTLIEVLVALLIFAFGLLGAAGLQLASLKSSQYSSQSVIATNLAREYGELMQSFPSVAASTSGSTVAFYINYTDAVAAATVAKSCTGAAIDCNAQAMATALRADWHNRLSTTLPSGTVEVCRDANPRDTSNGRLKAWGNCDASGSLTVIKVGWNVKKQNADSGLDQTWLTDTTRPQFAMALLGNLFDYKAP